MNASYQVDGGKVTSFNYGDNRFAEVRNDQEFLYLKIHAAEGFNLTETNLHIANSILEFPTVGKGNFPISKKWNIEKHLIHLLGITPLKFL